MINIILSTVILSFSIISLIMILIYYNRVKKVYDLISKSNQITQNTLYESNKANEEILKNLYSAKLSAEAIKFQLRDLGVVMDYKHYEELLKKKYTENRDLGIE